MVSVENYIQLQLSAKGLGESSRNWIGRQILQVYEKLRRQLLCRNISAMKLVSEKYIKVSSCISCYKIRWASNAILRSRL